MQKGNVYRNYKGGLYTYIGIGTPQAENHEKGALIAHELTAKHTETEEIVKVSRALYTRGYIVDVDHPVVLYKCHKDGQLWARPVDMFFGWVLEGGYPTTQRFKLVESK
jgi:hypothetical protein